MAATINKLGPGDDNSAYYTSSFRTVLEAHMTWLRNHPKTRVISVNPHDAYKYEGDFYGLLAANGIPKQFHWVTARLNDIYRASNLSEQLTTIAVADRAVLEHLRQIHATRHRR